MGGRGTHQGRSWDTLNPAMAAIPRPHTDSKNAYVNGTEPLPVKGAVCFSYGIVGHYSSACLTPLNQYLQSWEKAYLKAMIFPALENLRDQPGRGVLDMRAAQSFYSDFIKEDLKPAEATVGGRVSQIDVGRVIR